MPPHIENNSTAPIMSGLQTVQMSVGCPYCTKNVQLSVIVHHPEDVKKEVTDNSTLIALRPPDKNEPSSNKLSQKDDNSLPVNNKSEPVQVPQIPIETGRVNVGPRLSESISSVVPQQPGMLLEEVPLSVVYSDTDADNNTNSAFKNEAQEMDSIVIKDEPQDDFPFQPSIPEEHFQSNLSQKSMLQHAVPEPIPRSSMRPLSITKTAGMRRPKPYMRKHKRPVSATQTISDIANAGQSQPLMSSLEFQGEPQFSDNQFEIHPDNPMTMTFHGSESMQQFGSEESSASGYNEQFQQNIEGDAATGFGDEDAGSDIDVSKDEDKVHKFFWNEEENGANSRRKWATEDFIFDNEYFNSDTIHTAEINTETETQKKTRRDLTLFLREIKEKQNETRPLCDIPLDELDKIIASFAENVRKNDGSEFRATSVKSFIDSIFRYLRLNIKAYEDKDFNKDFSKTHLFVQRRMAVPENSKKRNLVWSLFVDTLFDRGIAGTKTAAQLLGFLVFNNMCFFELYGRFVHWDLLWGDIELTVSNTPDGEIMRKLVLTHRASRKKTDEEVEMMLPNALTIVEIPGSDKCPVNAYELYKSARPASLNEDPYAPFYLRPLERDMEIVEGAKFSNQRAGVNNIGRIVSKLKSFGKEN